MPERSLEALVDGLHRAAAESAAVTDGELLGRFLRSRDAAAFELIVWRHAAMVRAVCRRVLGRSPEVDDAFQAAFLVLLRRAGAIRRRESLAGWLHRVALRVAQRCLHTAAARRRRERHTARPEALPPAQPDDHDLSPLLHAEIDRLPERLRVPLVLCALEGKTNEEAARLLGVPHGTVLSRLSRARERLRRRLAQRGITAAGVATLLTTEPVSAALIDAALRTALTEPNAAGPAAALAQGVIQAMFLRKLTTVAAGCMLAASLLLGAGLGIGPRFANPANASDEPRTAAAKPPAEPAKEPPKDRPEKKAKPPAVAAPVDLLLPRKPLKVFHPDETRIIGTWKVTEVIANGEHRDPEEMRIIFGPFGTMLVHGPGAKNRRSWSYKLDLTMNYGVIHLTVDAQTQRGTYKFGPGDTLTLVLPLKDGQARFTLVRNPNSISTNWADALFVKDRTHDFGVVKPSDRLVHKFVVKNLYDRPIGIIGVDPYPNERVKADVTADSEWLQPGDEATIELTVDAQRLTKPATVKCRVSFEVKGLERTTPSGSMEPAPRNSAPGPAFNPNPGATANVYSSTELTLTLRPTAEGQPK